MIESMQLTFWDPSCPKKTGRLLSLLSSAVESENRGEGREVGFGCLFSTLLVLGMPGKYKPQGSPSETYSPVAEIR